MTANKIRYDEFLVPISCISAVVVAAKLPIDVNIFQIYNEASALVFCINDLFHCFLEFLYMHSVRTFVNL